MITAKFLAPLILNRNVSLRIPYNTGAPDCLDRQSLCFWEQFDVESVLDTKLPSCTMTDLNRRTPNIEDRGEADYFHGREAILDDFKERMQSAEGDPKRGTTFLIQAAPGAGKTALLHECAQRGKARGWQVAEIDPDGLFDPVELSEALRIPTPDKRKETSGKINLKVVEKTVTSEHHMPKTVGILNSDQTPLLLLLDEAQDLRTSFFPRSEEFRIASKCLKAIHNGKLKRPVMLIAAGLGTTKEAFRELGVSRFKDNCYIELGRLRREAERAVIVDWLQLNGRAKGDPLLWADPIAADTHGWPQHVSAYAQVAARQVRADRRRMTPAGLQSVLAAGRVKRERFYKSRADGIDEHHRAAIAQAFVNVRGDHTQTRAAIMECLLQTGAEKSEAAAVFNHALQKGVLDHRNGRYIIPIPSMRVWFLDNYLIGYNKSAGTGRPDMPGKGETGPVD